MQKIATKTEDIKPFLELKYREYANYSFIQDDPVQIPHIFSSPADIEIAGFITATISWGKRANIIKSACELFRRMDYAPYDFIVNGTERDFAALRDFKYRTFQPEDLQYFLIALKNIYITHGGMRTVFESAYRENQNIKDAILYFRQLFFEPDGFARTQKHVANPAKNSASKRLNMFLRWMVRDGAEQVDFGIWKGIPASALYMPLDYHSGNVARALHLLTRKQNDWKAVAELTEKLRDFDPDDPVKYDYALFGLGVYENYS